MICEEGWGWSGRRAGDGVGVGGELGGEGEESWSQGSLFRLMIETGK